MKIPKGAAPYKLIDPVIGGNGRYFQLPLLECDLSAEEVASIGNPGVASFNPRELAFIANIGGTFFKLMLTAAGINKIVKDSGVAPGFKVVDRPTLNLRPAESGRYPYEQVPISCLDYLTDIASGNYPVQAPAIVDADQSSISQIFSEHDRDTRAHILAASSATNTQVEFISRIAEIALDSNALDSSYPLTAASYMVDAVMITRGRIRTGWPVFEHAGCSAVSEARRLWEMAGALDMSHFEESRNSSLRLQEITRYIEALPRILSVNDI